MVHQDSLFPLSPLSANLLDDRSQDPVVHVPLFLIDNFILPIQYSSPSPKIAKSETFGPMVYSSRYIDTYQEAARDHPVNTPHH